MKKLYFFFIFTLCFFSSFSQRIEMETAFENSRYHRVIILGNQILEEQQGDYDIFLLIGKAHNALNEFEEALPYLIKANEYAEIEWQYAAAYVEIMEAYYAIDNKEKAMRYYNKGIHVRGTKEVQRKFQKLSMLFGYNPMYNDWISVKTEHFSFHFEDILSIDDVDNYIEERIEAFLTINEFYEATLPKRIDFFVWKSKGVAQKKLKKFLGFTNPKYCISHNKMSQTLGHEIAHSISYWYYKNNTRNRFINEGIGVYFDLSGNNRMDAAKGVLQYKRRISVNPVDFDIETFWLNPDKYPESIMYPVAGAFVEYLIKFDKKKFLKLSKDQTFKNAESIYGRWQLERLILNFNKKLNS